MRKNSAEQTVRPSQDAQPQSHWCDIGINAVAAASICKSHDRSRREPDAKQPSFPLDDTEFATD